MVLIDTSAWIEFLRDTGSSVCAEVDRLLSSDFAITDPVLMEVLAGARDERHLRELRGLLGLARMTHAQPGDFDEAAQLFRVCRRGGRTVRRLIDCLIAAVAIRDGIPILHADNDFKVLARFTQLKEHTVR